MLCAKKQYCIQQSSNTPYLAKARYGVLLLCFNDSYTLRQKSYPFVDETSTAARSRGKL